MTWLKDTAERVIRTFLAVFVTTILAGAAGVHDISTARALAISAVSAAVTAAIAAVASLRKGTITPASVVKGTPAE